MGFQDVHFVRMACQHFVQLAVTGVPYFQGVIAHGRYGPVVALVPRDHGHFQFAGVFGRFFRVAGGGRRRGVNNF